MHACTYVCSKFELISIKIRYFINFKNYSKMGPKSLYWAVGKIFSKITRRKFLLFFYIHRCSYVERGGFVNTK